MSDLYDKFDKKLSKATSKYRRTNKHTLIKAEGKVHLNAEKGIVVTSLARILTVESLNSSCNYFDCTLAGALVSENINSTIVAVGDVVWYEPEEKLSQNGINKATIVKIDDRKNCFSRKAAGKEPYEQVLAANIDKVLIFMSANDPVYNRRLIDRLLVTAELNGIEPVICINKIDLIEIDDLISDFDAYKNLNIQVCFASIKNNIGVENLYELLKESNVVMCGPSGVGKSSFLNKIFGSDLQMVKDIAERTSKGKHTTSYTKMFRLPEGGSIIDTPGIREFGIWGLEKNEIALYFHDFDEYNRTCKYYQCTHTHEPGCTVIEALEQDKLDSQRYESYINIFDSLE